MEDGATFILFVILIVIFGVIYFIPTIVAFRREHSNKWPIFLVNFVFGTTVIGWVASLIWAMNVLHTSKVGTNGGESGLNIFANDVKTVKWENSNSSSYIDNLIKIKSMLDEGIINREEFENLKLKIMSN